jgi:hypothetical protein
MQDIYTKEAFYKDLIDTLTNMPRHTLGTFQQESKNNIKFAVGVLGTLEAGIRFPASAIGRNARPVTFRLGLFCDYSILNTHIPKNAPFLQNQSRNPTDFVPLLNNVLLSESSKGLSFNPLLAGVKFTIIFKLPGSEPCLCDWY